MNQRIGNIGLLNLLNATEDSIKGIERIENVGEVLYRQGSAHLLTLLNIGNIGATVELPEGYNFHNGKLTLDQSYIESIQEPAYLFVNGSVIVANNVQPESLKKGLLHLMVNGKVYSPTHLSGMLSQVITKGSFKVETYQGEPPRFENGNFVLTNSFLESIEEPIHLVVSGVLSFSQDLNMEKFEEKIEKLRVNGVVTLYEEQEPYLYKKTASLTTSTVEVIPSGFEVVKKPLRLNARSIRRFRQKNLYTRKPILIDEDVSREMFLEAITQIYSKSVIICHEKIEDLVYECLSLLETEVLSYEHQFIFIEGDEFWFNDQFIGLEKPVNFIVNGKLTLDHDVTDEVLRNKVAAIDILGEVMVREKKLKGSLQHLIRVNTGSIEEETEREQGAALNNVGELSL